MIKIELTEKILDFEIKSVTEKFKTNKTESKEIFKKPSKYYDNKLNIYSNAFILGYD